jgi:hydrogenase maturation protein HypF
MNKTGTRREPGGAVSDRLIRVRGTVQGVGFRPFVQVTAVRCGLRGWVRNDAQGVLIRAVGTAEAVAAFAEALVREAPVSANVESIEDQVQAEAAPIPEEFAIAESVQPKGDLETAVPADLAICGACRAELSSPENRRRGYPLINCTQCGPRYSIIEQLPYDRVRTTMSGFRMCAACEREYGDATNRRFHAEPNACAVCGPRLALTDAVGEPLAENEAALWWASSELTAGRIVAVKGIGGFHLMCDATNEAAVAALRKRKHREEKPLAVMFPSRAALEAVAEVSAEAAALLGSPQAPVVLVKRRGECGLAASVAPGNPWVGALLPYAPLHVLLLERCGRPLVATSANLSEEPLCIDDDEARGRLKGMADFFLGHDRPIARPVDDSVVRFSAAGARIMLRRARGFAPSPLTLPAALAEGVLCVGGQMKNTVAVAVGRSVVLSPHIGDLGNAVTQAAFGRTIEMLGQLQHARYAIVAHDKHPGYASTGYAQKTQLRCVGVQHHLAHVLACLLENRATADDVLGVAWDGTGYGEDGTVWGGEFILLQRGVAKRFARLRPFRLPGGEAAVRDARRVALALVHETGSARLVAELGAKMGFNETEVTTLRAMLGQGINSPVCSSAGRLFDAAGTLLGVGMRNSFEGQVPLAVEALAMESAKDRWAMTFTVRDVRGGGAVKEVDWEPALEELLAPERSAPSKAAAFHRGLARAIAEVARAAGVGTVALTGGCFQNGLLHDLARAELEQAGCRVLVHRQLSPNDGNIAAGQALGVLWNLTDVLLP